MMLLEYQKPLQYKKLSRYPSTDQDISLKVAADVPYAKLTAVVENVLAKAEAGHGYQWAIAAQDIYEPKEGKTKNISYRITLTHYERTLTTEEVNKLLDEVAKAAKTKAGATRL
jgi:phenylalanyl-tRNA synthetase beta subunit